MAGNPISPSREQNNPDDSEWTYPVGGYKVIGTKKINRRWKHVILKEEPDREN